MNECKYYIQYRETAICNCNNIYMHAGIWFLSVSVVFGLLNILLHYNMYCVLCCCACMSKMLFSLPSVTACLAVVCSSLA